MELIKENIYLVRNKRIFPSNTYILKSNINNDCILFDPGFDFEMIDEGINSKNLNPIAIISTHGHFDHIASVSFFKNKFNIPFYIHKSDLKICESANFYLKMANINYKIDTPKPDKLFKGAQQELLLNNFNLMIYNFPGHSAGSCLVKYNKILFTGDIIYKNGLGAGSIPRENKPLLRKSILKIFETFPENNYVLPGHGALEMLGKIRANNKDLINFLYKNVEDHA